VFWILVVYPRAGLIALATLAAFAVFAFMVPHRPILGVLGCLAVGAGGLELTIRVARWEARRRGGTGYEGSGPIEPRGPGSWG
jgi:hypothetical protein